MLHSAGTAGPRKLEQKLVAGMSTGTLSMQCSSSPEYRIQVGLDG